MKIVSENVTNFTNSTEFVSQHISPSFNQNETVPSPFFNQTFEQTKPQIKSILQKEKCRNDKNCQFTKEAEHCDRYYHTCTKKDCNITHDTHLNRFTHVCNTKNCTNQQELHLKQFYHPNQDLKKKNFNSPQIPRNITSSPWKTPNDFQNPNGIRELESMKQQIINKNYYTKDDLLEMRMIENKMNEIQPVQYSPKKNKNDFTFDEFSNDYLDDDITERIEFQSQIKNENNQSISQFFTNSTPEQFQSFKKEINPMNQFMNNSSFVNAPLDVNDISQFFLKSNVQSPKPKETKVERISNFIEKKRCNHFYDCKLTHDKEHSTRYYHKCSYDEKCNHASNNFHCNCFLHTCSKGEKCTNKEKEHQTLFLHQKKFKENSNQRF
jgi:hypothetical protein